MTGLITMREIETAITALQNRESVGNDGITAEVAEQNMDETSYPNNHTQLSA